MTDQTVSTTLFPHLLTIRETLEQAMSPVPVIAHADRSAVLAQVTPAVHLLPGKTVVGDVLRRGRTISNLVLNTEWEVLCLVRDASDQRDKLTALLALGELQATALQAIGQGLTPQGGVIHILDLPPVQTWAGGLVSGSILFRLGFVFRITV